MIITVISVILVFGILVFVHELGHFMFAKLGGISVTEFAIGMGPALFKKQYKETLYSVRALPFGGFTSMEDDVTKSGSFFTKPFGTKVLVLVAGSVFNIILGYVILVILTAMNGYVGTTTIVKFDDNAVSHGLLQEGDTILKLNNRRVRTSNDITYELLRDSDGLIDIELLRNNEKVNVPIQFEMQEIADGVNAIKMDFFVLAKEPTAMDYLTYPINWSLSIIKQVWGSLIDLFTGRVPVNQLSGPVGIVGAIGKASQMGLDSLLLMTAFIAINLGVFNLLPLPILDGGKILIFTVELIRGKPTSEKTLDLINNVSMGLILLLVIYATGNDIFRLINK